jgi:hypothetical protein
MNVGFALITLMFTAEVAFAGRFDLPKEGPQFSIQMPDRWETAIEGDHVTSRPAKDSKLMISVFGVPAAKNLEDAFGTALKQVTASYRDVKLGKLSEQRQAGLTVYGGHGEAEKAGFELRISVAAFTADGQRFFGLVWTADEASRSSQINEIDEALASLQTFTEPPPKTAK